MNIFPYKPKLVKKQHRWWKTPKALFSPKYSLRVITFTAFLITIGSISYVWQWANYLQIGYRIQALDAEKARIQQRVALLEIEASFLTKLERLDHIATTRLNMIPPSFSQRLIIPPTSDDE